MKIEESNIVETNDYRVIIYPASRPLRQKKVRPLRKNYMIF
jgi:hypothetical protein